MKNILLAIIISAIAAFSVVAQHPHVHIYRNDGKFTTHKVSALERIQFSSKAWGDSDDMMRVALGNGTTETIAAAAVDSTVVGRNVPVIRVKLTDYPNLSDLIKNDEFTKNTVYRATLTMDGNGVYDDISETEVEFRGRGNSTWNMPKTPYRFKFAKKQSVCGLPKAKTFALIANHIDCSLMRNAVAFEMARMLEMPFTNHTVPVDVYLNGHYRGAYFLTEKIGIGGGSVDIDETKGMLFELDTNYDEDYKFRYSFRYGGASKNLPVMVKDPDLAEMEADDATGTFKADAYFGQWKADITKMFDAVTQRQPGESLEDVIDVNSAANYVMVFLLARNLELTHPKSVYMYKEELGAGSVYHFGPVWDFDWAFTYDNREGQGKYNQLLLEKDGKAGGCSFFTMLVKNRQVRQAIDRKWEKFYSEQWPELKRFMDEYASLIEPSAKTNGMIWPRDSRYRNECTFEFRQKYKTLRDWLEKRVEWINSHPQHGLYE